MPIFAIVVAGALFGGAATLFDALREDGGARKRLQTWRESAAASLSELEQEYHHFVRDKIDPLFGSTRDAQLQEVDGEALARPLIPYERMINRNLGISAVIVAAALATAPLGPLVQAAATLPLALYIGKDFLEDAYHSVVKRRKLTLEFLGAVNLAAMWIGGYYLIGGVSFMLIHLGMKLTFITEDRSHKRLSNIFGQQPRKVWVLNDGVEVEIPFEKLQVGDLVLASAGQVIAVDGIIVDGYASIDQRILTGESQPAEKGVGDAVLAATVVLAGQITIRAEKAGNETVVSKIGEMLENTASYQLDITTQATRIADASIIPTLVAAAAALFTVGYAGMVAITGTIFGFNLRISGPIALLTYLEVSARQNILLKDGRSFEILTTVDTVVFDKTGTLTLEQPHVANVYTFGRLDAAQVLRYAATIEQRQSHPIAHAILAHAKESAVSPLDIEGIRLELGYGLCAEIADKLVRVGSERFMALEKIALPQEAVDLQQSCHARGHSVVMVAIGDELAGAIELEPTIRPEAKSVIGALRSRGLDLYIISGDQEGPTRQLAETLGIDNYFANTLPENKAQLVERLQQEGRTICFVGDGINDSLALKKADVSVSLSGATSVAIDTAQVVLMDATLQNLPLLFKLAEELDANLKTSLALAIVPGIGIWAGIFFLNLGILGATVIYESSIWTGIANALHPLLKYKRKSGAAEPEPDSQAATPRETNNKVSISRVRNSAAPLT